MRVQQVVMPGGEQSWTVLDADGEPVPVVEAIHLQALDRSPTTVRRYATSLKLWLEFLSRIGVAVDGASVDHVSRFVAWLRAPAANVTVLAGGTGRCCAATVNKHMAALFAFYDYRARSGVELAQVLVAWRRARTGAATVRSCTTSRPVGRWPRGRFGCVKNAGYPRTLTNEQLVRRPRARTGIEFSLHMLRHSRATDLLHHGSGWTWWPGCSPTARLRRPRRPTSTSKSSATARCQTSRRRWHTDASTCRGAVTSAESTGALRPVPSSPADWTSTH